MTSSFQPTELHDNIPQLQMFREPPRLLYNGNHVFQYPHTTLQSNVPQLMTMSSNVDYMQLQDVTSCNPVNLMEQKQLESTEGIQISPNHNSFPETTKSDEEFPSVSSPNDPSELEYKGNGNLTICGIC